MSKDTKSLAHTKWNCKYHIVFASKYRRQVVYRMLKEKWEEYYESYVTAKVWKYWKQQHVRIIPTCWSASH